MSHSRLSWYTATTITTQTLLYLDEKEIMIWPDARQTSRPYQNKEHFPKAIAT